MTEAEKIVKRYVDCELNEVEFLAEITALTTRFASEAAADMRHRAADRCLAHDGKMYDSEGCYVRQSTMQDVATAILALAPPDGASEGRGGPDLDALEATVEKARKMVSALCQGEQRWIMSVPAEPDNDPDLVIAAGLRVASQLIREARGEGAPPPATGE